MQDKVLMGKVLQLQSSEVELIPGGGTRLQGLGTSCEGAGL